MLQWLNPFRQPTPAQVAAVQLQHAQRGLLAAQDALEHARAMVAYHQASIKRLTPRDDGRTPRTLAMLHNFKAGE